MHQDDRVTCTTSRTDRPSRPRSRGGTRSWLGYGRRVTTTPAAVLWDMDGTLVDTEPYWMASEVAVVHARGGMWTHDDGLQLVGQPLLVSAQIVLEQTGIPGQPDELVDALIAGVAAKVRQVGPPWRPGARELLRALGDAGVPCALVTSSYAVLAETVAAAVPGAFATVVTGEGVRNGKPHPEPYLLAAERLGVRPEDCVVLEDSPVGVRAGLAAGAHVVAVPLMVPIPAQAGLSRLGTLDGVGPDLLDRVYAGEVVDELADAVRR